MSAPPRVVAYQGEPGAFSEAALRACYGAAPRGLPCEDFAAVFASLASGAADAAVVPVQNTIIGPILPVHALLNRGGVTIVGALRLPIRLCAIACPGATLAGLRQVESHPAALAQCQRWLTVRHLPAVAAADTAGSVRTVLASRDPTRAALASARAATLYGGVILATDVQDVADNFTEFHVLAPAHGKRPPL